MSTKLWKKSNFPSIEELAREVAIKKRLTLELSRSVQALQSENVGSVGPICSSETVGSVCDTLEAIFIHGIKTKFKVSAVFLNTVNKMPDVHFWPVSVAYSHKDVVTQICSLKDVNTDIGRCRAWLRLAMNDGLIISYIETMASSPSALKKYYDSVAYLRDREEPDIMKQILEGLSTFSFQLSFRTSTLNFWNDAPLVLAGIWTPPVSPQPVMPAVDVIQFFTEQESKTQGKDIHREIVLSSSSKEDQSQSDVVDTVEEQKTLIECSADGDKLDNEDDTLIKNDLPITVSSEITRDFSKNIEPVIASSEIPQDFLKNIEHPDECEEQEENMSKISSSDSIPDCIPDIIMSFNISSGNNLLMQSGWSSEFDCEIESHEFQSKEDSDVQSYDSLLQSYNKTMGSGIFGTPETTDQILSSYQYDERIKENSENVSVESKSPDDSEYEIIPKTGFFSPDTVDERTQNLLSIVGNICSEKGLDQQNYQCNGCGCYVGMIYGKANLCSYDGLSYCSDCHSNEEYYIPGRIIHNWDFKKYPVSNHTKLFLDEIEQRPLLNLKILNPLIYTVIEEMAQLQGLRRQLTFLRSYIFTCKESIAEELRKKVWPREYLYEHVHLYSVSDLIQASSGVLQSTLQKIITFAKKHVFQCQLCKEKGFICEICGNAKVIYPFDLDTTYHCDFCLSVYHSSCMEIKKYCPKCERKRKRQEMSNSVCQEDNNTTS